MNSYSLNELLALTIILSIPSILLATRASRTYINAAAAYWFGWIFLSTCTVIAINQHWMPPVGGLANQYIISMHLGAFVGFSLSSLLIRNRAGLQPRTRFLNETDYLVGRISKWPLIILFIVGLVVLAERLTIVGLSAEYFTSVRKVYNLRESSIIFRLGSHLAVMASFLVLMLGARDAVRGANVKFLLVFLLAASPLGIANGGRSFLLSYSLIYLFSLFLLRGQYGRLRYILTKREWGSIGMLLVASLVLFALIGFNRGGYGAQLDILYTIIIWPTSTMGAMDSWVLAAKAAPSTNGMNTFGWFVDILHRFSMVDFSFEREVMERVLRGFDYANDSADVIPRSILPDLIFDFGEAGIFGGMGLVAFFLQSVVTKCNGRGIFLHTLAVMCCYAAFTTIQNSLFAPGFVVTLFWAAFFSFLINTGSRRLEYAA